MPIVEIIRSMQEARGETQEETSPQTDKRPQVDEEPLTQSTEEKERIKERALQILEESGAYQACQDIKNEFWPLGEILETPMLEEDYREHIGLFLLARSGFSGTVDYYYGKMIIVGANVKTGSVLVLSHCSPVEVVPEPEEGWTEDKKAGLERAIARAYFNPANFGGCDGLAGEQSDEVRAPLFRI